MSQTQLPQIKCFVCRKRTNLVEILAGMTCTNCTAFLAKYGHQYKQGENIDQYQSRLEEVLEMQAGN